MTISISIADIRAVIPSSRQMDKMIADLSGRLGRTPEDSELVPITELWPILPTPRIAIRALRAAQPLGEAMLLARQVASRAAQEAWRLVKAAEKAGQTVYFRDAEAAATKSSEAATDAAFDSHGETIFALTEEAYSAAYVAMAAVAACEYDLACFHSASDHRCGNGTATVEVRDYSAACRVRAAFYAAVWDQIRTVPVPPPMWTEEDREISPLPADKKPEAGDPADVLSEEEKAQIVNMGNMTPQTAVAFCGALYEDRKTDAYYRLLGDAREALEGQPHQAVSLVRETIKGMVIGAVYSRAVRDGTQTASEAKAAELERIQKILSLAAASGQMPKTKAHRSHLYDGGSYYNMFRAKVPHDGKGPPCRHWEDWSTYIPFSMAAYAALVEASTGVEAINGRPNIRARDWLSVMDHAHHWAVVVDAIHGDVGSAVRKEWPARALDVAAPFLDDHHKVVANGFRRSDIKWFTYRLVAEVRQSTPRGESPDSREEAVKGALRAALIDLIEHHAERMERFVS